MFFQKIRRLLKLCFIVAIAIVLFNFFTVAPSHQPQTSKTIKGVWITHVGNSLLTYTGLTDNVFYQLSRHNT
jgi:uncharacterized lipoprotein YddW (UPF0748 family)